MVSISEIKIDKNGYERGNYSDLIHRQKAYRNVYLKNRDKYPLPFSKYIVHHINGDKKNNKIANLQLVTKEEHDRIHGIVKEEPLTEYIEKQGKVRYPHGKQKFEENTKTINMDYGEITAKELQDEIYRRDKPKQEKKADLDKRDITKDIVVCVIIFFIILWVIVQVTNEGWSSIVKSEAIRVYGLMFFFLLIGFLIYIKIKK